MQKISKKNLNERINDERFPFGTLHGYLTVVFMFLIHMPGNPSIHRPAIQDFAQSELKLIEIWN